MKRGISSNTRHELIGALSERYRQGSRSEKGKILNELVKLTKSHRKHAIRLMNQRRPSESISVRPGRRIYDEAVREALVAIWEAADRICGKRLRVVMPDYVESLESHGHLKLNSDLRNKLLAVSASTIDRILTPMRDKARGGSKRRRRSQMKVKGQIPVRTFGDWEEPEPGYFETDFVAHNGGLSAGSCVHSLVLTDICSGWTECVALVAREQNLVLEALEVLQSQLPVPLLGIDTDNDGAFINESLIKYCESHHVKFTRSRAYLKNDQAWIEQKNGAVVRRFVGHQRLKGILAAQVLGRLHRLTRLYVNFFQPSFKLRDKRREGAKVRKSYFPPATPCDRLLNNEKVSEAAKERLREQKRCLDPVRLLHAIRELQATLAALVSSNGSKNGETPESKNLDQFLKQLPTLWKEGEVRPTHRKAPSSPRNWRTRVDPFESVWPELLDWLQCDPDTTAKDLFLRLRVKYPGTYKDGQLRTAQRRVKGWRRAMARELIGISQES